MGPTRASKSRNAINRSQASQSKACGSGGDGTARSRVQAWIDVLARTSPISLTLRGTDATREPPKGQCASLANPASADASRLQRCFSVIVIWRRFRDLAAPSLTAAPHRRLSDRSVAAALPPTSMEQRIVDGLRNLGNTCYFNTVVQVRFGNDWQGRRFAWVRFPCQPTPTFLAPISFRPWQAAPRCCTSWRLLCSNLMRPATAA